MQIKQARPLCISVCPDCFLPRQDRKENVWDTIVLFRPSTTRFFKEGGRSKRDDSILTMSQYTSEYLQEKLQKEFNPIHLVRENVLPSL